MEQNRNNCAHSIFDFFKGTWKFDRLIEGHGSMTGDAAFTDLEPETLSYHENGIHGSKQDGTQEFYQTYLYQYRERTLHAHFKDGRPFHWLKFQRDKGLLKAKAVHLCGNDTYTGEYIFHENDNFSLTWDVQGPRKNYLIETKYFRQATC